MALAIEKTLKNGATGTYLRISDIFFTNGSNQAQARVQLWKCQDTRRAEGTEPLYEEVFHLNLIDDGSTDIVQRCYDALKLSTDFTGCQDC